MLKILLSPAKKMEEDPDSIAPASQPEFLAETGRLLEILRAMPFASLKALLACSEELARLNYDRYQAMDLRRAATPALLAYQGIQYQYMAPQVFEQAYFDYLQRHLCILSGFYGVLRPLDAVVPYRLEMQARLTVDGCRGLYSFWGAKLAASVCRDADVVLDLASAEYARAVKPHLPPELPFVKCVFGELSGKNVVEKGVYVKMARGEMVRWMAERQIFGTEPLKHFSRLGFAFDPGRSTPRRLVFLR